MLYKQISKDERKLIDYLYNFQKEVNQVLVEKLKEITINTVMILNLLIENIEKQYHKHMFHTFRYKEFNELFLKWYDKRFHGVQATYNKIISLYGDIKHPSCRQIFNWIKDNRWIIKRNDRLRQYYKKGGKRSIGIFSKFNNKRVLQIWIRPKNIDKHEEYGHWEVDLIIGRKSNGFYNLITLTERMTRETYIRKIRSKNAMKCNSEIYKLIKENNLIVKSITCDNGVEFEKIGILAHWLDIKVYFCEPYASYQRGSNEHANGLIRRMYKKGTDFNLVSHQDIIDVQNKINNMPRKLFNWLSSNEYKNKILGK